jgi:hypothetical protein
MLADRYCSTAPATARRANHVPCRLAKPTDASMSFTAMMENVMQAGKPAAAARGGRRRGPSSVFSPSGAANTSAADASGHDEVQLSHLDDHMPSRRGPAAHRMTASPSDIALLAGMIDSPGAEEQPGAAGDENAGACTSESGAASAMAGGLDMSSSLLGMLASPMPAGKHSMPTAAAILPSLAALFGAQAGYAAPLTAAAGADITATFGGMSRVQQTAGGHNTSIMADMTVSDLLNMSVEREAATVGGKTAVAGGAGAASASRGPAHRLKTPGRSCLAGGSSTVGVPAATTADRAAGPTTRARTDVRPSRGVIFGSPQAAEFAQDAPAAALTTMDRAAVRQRFKLAEPELPFPSLENDAAATAARE